MPGKTEKEVFIAVEVLRGSFKPVYVRKLPDKAVLTTEEVLLARLSAREDRVNSFLHSALKSYEVGARPFMCRKELTTPFSPPRR